MGTKFIKGIKGTTVSKWLVLDMWYFIKNITNTKSLMIGIFLQSVENECVNLMVC